MTIPNTRSLDPGSYTTSTTNFNSANSTNFIEKMLPLAVVASSLFPLPHCDRQWQGLNIRPGGGDMETWRDLLDGIYIYICNSGTGKDVDVGEPNYPKISATYEWVVGFYDEITHPETNSTFAPGNGCLEIRSFPSGDLAYVQGQTCC